MGVNNLIFNIQNFEGQVALDLEKSIKNYKRFTGRIEIANKILGFFITNALAEVVTTITASIYGNIWSGKVVKKLQAEGHKRETIKKFSVNVLNLNNKDLTSKCIASAVRVAIMTTFVIATFSTSFLLYFKGGNTILGHNGSYIAGGVCFGIIPIISHIALGIFEKKSLVNTFDLYQTATFVGMALLQPIFDEAIFILFLGITAVPKLAPLLQTQTNAYKETWVDRFANRCAGLLYN